MQFTATTQEAAQILRTSESTLRRLRRTGVLRPGIHFCASGAGSIAPNLLWAPEACQEALAERSRQILCAPSTTAAM
jgi:hypothetical protein